MERQRPETSSDEIDLYVRTYYSLLRSSGEVRVRSFEEAHAYSDSSLHLGSLSQRPDTSALGYAAARLPACMPRVERVILGQSHEQFEQIGLDVRSWSRVRARGRRRPLRYDGETTLATFIASASDIDDLVPILTAYQIEWNKIHDLLASSELADRLAREELEDDALVASLASALEVSAGDLATLASALDGTMGLLFRSIAERPSDRRINLLAGSFSQYQRAAQRWWSGVEPEYLRETEPKRPPIYFVSSNTHSFANLLGGYALAHRDGIVNTARAENPAGVWPELERALAEDEGDACNLLYFSLREHIHRMPGAREEVQRWDEASGIRTVPDPGQVEVSAQVIEISKLSTERLDPRVRVEGADALADSDATIVNIDYPLGMAAYQLLSRVGQGAGPMLGVYVMGKAATLNGRVGDVMISKVVQDEHSKNAYILRNCFAAKHVAPHLSHGSVLDNQKALTVRSAFLQNRDYMGVFYREGYTVLEMEAGPYLSAIYELVDPRRHPRDEIVALSDRAPFDVGILHYASDTPYSRRKELLSKSLGYFGMDATYACAIAIVRRILELEVVRCRGI
jgi:hypothetical protein